MNKKEDKRLSNDSFYIRLGGFDYQRIPLLEPFELIKMKGDSIWSLNTSVLASEAGSLSPIDSIYSDGKQILGHQSFYQDTEWEEYKTPEIWFRINKNNGEWKLVKYNDRNDFLKSNIDGNKLKDVNYYYLMFKEDIVLPWFNDSIKTSIKDLKQ